MRLAVVRQRYTPFGGAERFLDAALAALIARGIGVTLFTRAWADVAPAGVEMRIVDPFHVGGFWRDAGFARAVCREIRRDAPDLVQSHERVLCCDVFRAGDGVHAAWLDERARHLGPIARAALRADPRHRHRLAIERKMFASGALRAVICNSVMVKDDIRTRFHVPGERLHVIRNAVDRDVFCPALRTHRAAIRSRHGIGGDALLFLLVGSGFERKGVAAAIDALADVPAPAHLLVVGHDKHLARYAKRARTRKLSQRVTFAGAQADPRPYYGAADAFVLPTLYDPCPNAALEAMACALPIITSTRSGAAEIALAHDAGLVCAPGDAASVASHMRTLSDGVLRARLGANARDAVAPLTREAMTERLAALYRALLAA